QDQHRKLEAQEALTPHIVEREQNREGRARKRQDLHESREAVVYEGAVEQILGGLRLARDEQRRSAKNEDRDDRDAEARPIAMKDTPQQKNYRGEHNEELGED